LRFSSALALALTGALVIAPSLPAQQPQPPAGSSKLVDQPKGTLKINVLEGEGGRNNIRSRTAVAPVVEVKDAADKPVSGAEVVFQLPPAGPGGSFNGWLKTQTVRTDDQGKATVNGYAPNTEAGRFNMKVTATMGNQTGSAVIAQSNIEGSSSASGSSGKSNTWKWIAALGGAGLVAGIAAAVAGGDSKGSSTARSPVTISAGSVTVATPR